MEVDLALQNLPNDAHMHRAPQMKQMTASGGDDNGGEDKGESSLTDKMTGGVATGVRKINALSDTIGTRLRLVLALLQ